MIPFIFEASLNWSFYSILSVIFPGFFLRVLKYVSFAFCLSLVPTNLLSIQLGNLGS